MNKDTLFFSTVFWDKKLPDAPRNAHSVSVQSALTKKGFVLMSFLLEEKGGEDLTVKTGENVVSLVSNWFYSELLHAFYRSVKMRTFKKSMMRLMQKIDTEVNKFSTNIESNRSFDFMMLCILPGRYIVFSNNSGFCIHGKVRKSGILVEQIGNVRRGKGDFMSKGFYFNTGVRLRHEFFIMADRDTGRYLVKCSPRQYGNPLDFTSWVKTLKQRIIETGTQKDCTVIGVFPKKNGG